MKETLKENAGIALAAGLTIAALFAIFTLLDLAEIDWERWSRLGGFTLIVFGYLFIRSPARLRKARCSAAFMAMLAAHVIVLYLVTRTGREISIGYYMIVLTIEAGLFDFMLTLLAAGEGSRETPKQRRRNGG